MINKDKICNFLKISFWLAVFGSVFLVWSFWSKPEVAKVVTENQTNPQEMLSEKGRAYEEKVNIENEKPDVEEKLVFEDVFFDVPFTSQAPTGNWDNPLFQDGCEEASVLMAMAWISKKSFSSKGAETEILAISAWEEKIFGHAVDSSVDDTARIIREYYEHENVEVLKNITADDIKKELMKGRLVIVPVNGKVLANPHYTPPGPDQHMLLVVGYDSKTDEFISNDPGTKFGKHYRYSAKAFADAIWSYPSGSSHLPYPGIQAAKKDMISIY